MEYNLEIEKAVEKIKKEKAKLVCIQLPDGLKPRAKEICDKLKEKTDAEIIIWAGSCFGACDIPLDIERLGVNLLIQWGHSEWKNI
jgi:diphthamide biosynthesis enzyme Dph1/Dph2-like protein